MPCLPACEWIQKYHRLEKLKQLMLQDLSSYNKNAVIIAKKYFNVADIDDYYKKADAKPLIFCHFARGLGEKVYNEVTEFKDLYKTLMEVCIKSSRAPDFTLLGTLCKSPTATCFLAPPPFLSAWA